MPSPIAFRRGSDFRAYFQDSLTAREQACAAQTSQMAHWRTVWDKLRGARTFIAAGAHFRHFLVTEFSRLSAVNSISWRRAAPARAKASPPTVEDQRLEFEAVRNRLEAMDDPAAALERWASDLSRERAHDFRLRPAARKLAPSRGLEPRSFADVAVESVFIAGRAIWRLGHPLSPAMRFSLDHSGPILKVAAICFALVGAANFLAQWPQGEPEMPPSPAAAPESAPAPQPHAAWIGIVKPYRFYTLAAPPPFARAKLDYAARRHTTGGGREDVLTLGEFSEGPFLRLSIYRHGSEKTADAPFFVDMARRAALLGLGLGRAAFTENQATRFGDFETASLTMAEGKVARDDCRGFRLSVAGPGLTIAGFACAGGDEDAMGAGDFACLVNRLDLTAAGDGRSLRDFFAAAQTRGGRGCAPSASGKRK